MAKRDIGVEILEGIKEIKLRICAISAQDCGKTPRSVFEYITKKKLNRYQLNVQMNQ